MFSPATAPPPCAPLDPEAEGLAWLHEMAGMGMQAARKVFAEIMAEPEPQADPVAEPPPPAPQPDRFAALRELERLSRWVRLTIALRARLAEDARRPSRPAPRPPVPGRYDRLVRAHLDTREAMRLALSRETLVEHERDEILAAVDAWIRANPSEDFVTRPVSDVVRRLCRDLDLPFDPALWAEEPWALEERADPPITSAYRGWPPPDRGTTAWDAALAARVAPHPLHPP